MTRQLPLDLPHRPSLERDDLVVSAANRLAVEAVDAWPDWSHPVLLVTGPPGSGKSHLAEVWSMEAGARVAEEGSVGDILKTPTPQGMHFYNRIGTRRLDLTASQFAEPVSYDDQAASRAEAMADTSPEQYEALRARL